MPTEVPEEVQVPDEIQCTLVNVGVNMGDHAETTRTAITVDPNMTVRDMMERLFPHSRWLPRRYDSALELKFEQRLLEPRNIEPREEATF
jgi:hypothetical protein